MDNPLNIPPDAQHGRPKRGVSLMSKLPCLKRANHFWAVLSATESLSVDGTNVSGGFCSFGASIKLVKKKVSEMFIILDLTLHSFGPENFVTLDQIEKFQSDLIDENKSYKYYIIHSQSAILVGKKSSKTKAARTYAPTQ
jgi:hypothetical protein